jgi:hypothetical protein
MAEPHEGRINQTVEENFLADACANSATVHLARSKLSAVTVTSAPVGRNHEQERPQLLRGLSHPETWVAPLVSRTDSLGAHARFEHQSRDR